MPTDKELLYSMLDREIDNLLGYNSVLSLFSGTVKNYIHSFLEPYLNFFMEGEKLQVNMASAFIEEEVHNKLENFKKKFNEQEDNFDA